MVSFQRFFFDGKSYELRNHTIYPASILIPKNTLAPPYFNEDICEWFLSNSERCQDWIVYINDNDASAGIIDSITPFTGHEHYDHNVHDLLASQDTSLWQDLIKNDKTHSNAARRYL
jgi:hypothetical protein